MGEQTIIFDLESQSKMILDYLSQGKKLTSLEALKLFGCWRLGARIFDLKDKGHNIQTEMIKLSNGKRVAQYHLVKDELVNLDSEAMNKPLLDIKANDLTVEHREPNFCETVKK